MTPKEIKQATHMTDWRFAGLMLSYWCSARCRFCYVGAGPEHTFWADPHRIVEWWRQLETLANRSDRHVRVHITGGEPFGRPELLFQVLALAQDAGLPPADKIETNAFWATDDRVVRDALEKLKSFGVTPITTDADIFHQEFVPLTHVRRLVKIGQDVLGKNGVRVRWWNFYDAHRDSDFNFDELSDDEIHRLQAEALLAGKDRLTGKAAWLAAGLLTGRPPETFRDNPCRKAILASRHVHIDPYGNIFPGTCCGIVLGNAISEQISEVYDWFDQNGSTGPILPALVEQGPFGLIPLAQRVGFSPLPQGYVTKCQLCFHLRSTLFHANQCRKWLTPAECYPQFHT